MNHLYKSINYVNVRQRENFHSKNKTSIRFKSNFNIPKSQIENIDEINFTIPKNGLKITVAAEKDADDIANFICKNAEFQEIEDIEAKIKEFSKDAKKIIREGGSIHIIREGNQVLGCIELFAPLPDGAGLISNFGLAKNLRGKKIGTKILEHLIQDAKDSGKYAMLLLFAKEPVADGFYKKFGFEKIASKKMKELNKKDPTLPEDLVLARLILPPKKKKFFLKKYIPWLN